MLFMNTYEIDSHKSRHKNHPILGPATRFLADFRDMVDQNSDGWAYWKPALNSAKKLMTMIQNPNTATAQEFKKSVTPIKTLCTRYKLTCPSIEEIKS